MKTILANTVIGVAFLAAFTLIYLGFSTAAQADMTVGTYLQLRYSNNEADKTIMHHRIIGLGNGLSWSNVGLMDANKPLLFCVPEKLSLSLDNYLTILDKAIAQNVASESRNNSAAAAYLLIGLLETFPCAGKDNE